MSKLTPEQEHAEFLSFMQPLTIEKFLVVDLATGTTFRKGEYYYNRGSFSSETPPSLEDEFGAEGTNLSLTPPTTQPLPYGFELPLNHSMNSRVWGSFCGYTGDYFGDYKDICRTRRLVALPIEIVLDDNANGSASASWKNARYYGKNEWSNTPPPMPTSIRGASYARELVSKNSFLVSTEKHYVKQITTSFETYQMFSAAEYLLGEHGVSFSLYDPTRRGDHPRIKIRYGKVTRRQKSITLPHHEIEVNPYDRKQEEEPLLTFKNTLDNYKVFCLIGNESFISSTEGAKKVLYTLPLLMQNPKSKEALLTVVPGDIINIKNTGFDGSYFVEAIYRHGKNFPFIYLKNCV